MTYDGTITTHRPDPALVMTGELKDGRKVYVLRDMDPESPDTWENVVELTLVGESERHYALGTSDPYVQAAHDRFRNGVTSWHNPRMARMCPTVDTDDVVARYMRIFHNSEVMSVSLQDGNDWADGYLVLDMADAWEGIDVPAVLKGMAETWQQYFAGDVYGYIVVNEETGEEDSCWGFYGEPDELIKSGFDGQAYEPADLVDYDYA